MSRVMKGVLVVGVAAAAVYAVRNLLADDPDSSGETVLTFTDGSTKTLSYSDIQGREFVDIARKLVESGV